MTESPSDNPKNRKYPQKLYQYIGDEAQFKGMFYIRIAERDTDGNPWPKSEHWKFEAVNEDDVFMMSIWENHLQPSPHQKMLCSFEMRPENEDPVVGEKGIGGLLWLGSEVKFQKDFKQKGSQ